MLYYYKQIFSIGGEGGGGGGERKALVFSRMGGHLLSILIGMEDK